MNREHARLGVSMLKNGEQFVVEEKSVKYGRDYFAIFSNGMFLMPQMPPVFFGPLNFVRLFESRKDAGTFMREHGIVGKAVRIETTFTAHGV